MNQTTAAGLIGNRMQGRSRPWISMILVVFAISSIGADGPAPVSGKVRVKDPVLARQLIEQGGRLVADYGSFQIISTATAEGGHQSGGRIESKALTDFVELNAKRINTGAVEVRHQRKLRGAFAGRALHLVQFVGPIKPEWREALELQGVRVISYIPENAYLVRGDAKALGRLQAWAGQVEFVQWEGEYANEFKLNPDTRKREVFGLAAADTDDVFAIQILEDEPENSATLELIENLKSAPVQRDFRVMQYRNLIVRLPVDWLNELSARPDVISIQRYTDPDKRDERQSQIMAGNLLGGTPTGPGYLQWLAERGFTQAQFDASGFAVDVTDSGIDNGTTAPNHLGLYVNSNFGQGSRVVYNRLIGTPHGGSTLAGCDGHGNLNAHILAGAVSGATGFPHADNGGFQFGLGVCPFVRIGSSVVFDPDLFTSPNYADLQSRAYQDGARISANSWGVTNNTYTVDAQAFDALVRDAQPAGATFATPGNQEMVIVFAAGNRGNAANTVGAPGTAKNVITVGASENVRSLSIANGGKSTMGTDGCGYNDSIADSASDMATFSSRGPCSDGRQKPDLVAPGTHIVGGVPQLTPASAGLGAALGCFKASSICALSGGGTPGSTNNFFPLGQQFYTVSSGTSHSTPAVAGACALLRQYFINHNWGTPSPAMTKAYLMNSTRYLTGAGANDNLWSPAQGMGAVNLGRAFDDQPRILRDQIETDTFTASGQARVFTGRIVNTNEPLRVTLAWTDAPGSTIGNAFNNDLDLTIQVGAEVYLGNVFRGSRSVVGGSADARNNVENIFLPAGISGDVTVTITAANINSDGVPNFGGNLDQDFALVIYNATNITLPIITPAGTTLLAEGFSPINQAVDPGEMITLSLALKNTGTRTATNLLVSLLETNGVTASGAVAGYGNLPHDGSSIARDFTFVANGVAGGTVSPVFRLSDSSGELGLMQIELPLGQRVITSRQFTNATALVIPDSGAASVYPSLIVVSDLAGAVQNVTATLRGYSHSWPDDVDAMLVGPAGQKVMLLSDCGGGNARNGVTLTFDDAAVNPVPDSGVIATGSYKPTNVDATTDNFPAPASVGAAGKFLSAFLGTNPNGNWSLFIQDDGTMDSGSLTQGWVLSLTTSNLICASGEDDLADLAVTAYTSNHTVFAGSSFGLVLTITNRGPSPATFTTLTNQFPVGFVLESAHVSQGSWSSSFSSLRWSVGRIEVGAAAQITVIGKCLLRGSYTNNSAVAAFTSETNHADNTAAVGLTVLNGGLNLGVSTNTPPMLGAVPDRVVHAGALVHFAAVATDAESTADGLSFSLLASPVAATIDSHSGEFVWQTTDLDAGSTNTMTIQVADTGTPPLTATTSFAVTVVPRPLIAGITVHDGVVSVSWQAIVGQRYQLQSAANLLGGAWAPVLPDVTAFDSILTHTNGIGSDAQRFYRVLVLP